MTPYAVKRKMTRVGRPGRAVLSQGLCLQYCSADQEVRGSGREIVEKFEASPPEVSTEFIWTPGHPCHLNVNTMGRAAGRIAIPNKGIYAPGLVDYVT